MAPLHPGTLLRRDCDSDDGAAYRKCATRHPTLKDVLKECDCEHCKKMRRIAIAKAVGKIAATTLATTMAIEGAIIAAPAVIDWIGFGVSALQPISWFSRSAAVIESFLWGTRTGMAALKPAVALSLRALGSFITSGIAAKYFPQNDAGDIRLPETEEEVETLINDLIDDGKLCKYCRKGLGPEGRGICPGVCMCWQTELLFRE